MPNLAQMAKNVATLTIPIDENTAANVQYRPTKVTSHVMNMLSGGVDEMDQALVEVLKSWDMFEDETEQTMIPLTVERLAELPVDFKVDIARAIARDMRPETRAPRVLTAN